MKKERTELEKHYNKFNEEKRLTRRHGQVEFLTSMKYIEKYLENKPGAKIIDIGAGTGRYSVALAEKGYDVTAVELVKYNLGILKQKQSAVKAYQGNALNLSRFPDNTFDMALLFGPMYHLYTFEEKKQALSEAVRVTKPGGNVIVAYLMNEYSILMYCFQENRMPACIKDGKVTEDFQTVSAPEDLYSYVRMETIDRLNKETGVERVKIVAADGPANYMRPVLNGMSDETFALFMQYHLSTCEREDLIGASAHTIDILQIDKV